MFQAVTLQLSLLGTRSCRLCCGGFPHLLPSLNHSSDANQCSRHFLCPMWKHVLGPLLLVSTCPRSSGLHVTVRESTIVSRATPKRGAHPCNVALFRREVHTMTVLNQAVHWPKAFSCICHSSPSHFLPSVDVKILLLAANIPAVVPHSYPPNLGHALKCTRTHQHTTTGNHRWS